MKERGGEFIKFVTRVVLSPECNIINGRGYGYLES